VFIATTGFNQQVNRILILRVIVDYEICLEVNFVAKKKKKEEQSQTSQTSLTSQPEQSQAAK
jgi:hypothetical protein